MREARARIGGGIEPEIIPDPEEHDSRDAPGCPLRLLAFSVLAILPLAERAYVLAALGSVLNKV